MLEIIVFIIVVVINCLLGILVLFQSFRNSSARVFALTILSIIIWTVSNFFADVIKDKTLALLITRTAYAGALLVAVSFLYFSLIFPKTISKVSNRIKFFIWISTVLAVIICFTNLIAESIEVSFDSLTSPTIFTGSLYIAYIIYTFGLMATAFLIFIRKAYKEIGSRRTQIQYLLTGTILTTVGVFLTNLIIPYFTKDFSITKYGPYFTVFFVAFTTYAIIKHRLLDIVVIIRKVTILFILLAIILGIFSMVAFGLPFVFADSLPEDTFQITLVAVAFIVALFFQPLRRSIEEFTDRWFFKGAYKPQQVIDELSEKISTIIDLRVLLDATAQILLKAFRSEHAVFSVREKIGRVESAESGAEAMFGY